MPSLFCCCYYCSSHSIPEASSGSGLGIRALFSVFPPLVLSVADQIECCENCLSYLKAFNKLVLGLAPFKMEMEELRGK